MKEGSVRGQYEVRRRRTFVKDRQTDRGGGGVFIPVRMSPAK